MKNPPETLKITDNKLMFIGTAWYIGLLIWSFATVSVLLSTDTANESVIRARAMTFAHVGLLKADNVANCTRRKIVLNFIDQPY